MGTHGTSERPKAEFEQHLWKLQPGDHIGCLFSSTDEHCELLSTFMRHGLERRERVAAVVCGPAADDALRRLESLGANVGFYRREGQLTVVDAGDFCADNGRFDPTAAVGYFRRMSGEVLREGHTAARLWLEVPDAESIGPYEAALNAFLPGSRCLALCPYDRRRFPPEALLTVMESHPLAVVGAELFDNFYYMPGGGGPQADPACKLNHWLDRLEERRASETQIRTLTRKLMKSQEDERRMISRELHDRVGQDLSTLRIELETMLDRPLPPDGLRARISQLSARLERSILAVRDLAYDFRPPGLEIGLAPAVSMLCSDFSEKTGIRVDFIAAGVEKLQLEFDFQINLYRMIQEGLNNIHKHAHAAHAVVRVAAAYPHLLLRIEDDGCGFDMERRAREIDSEKRMGLRSLKERADLLGGVMAVRSVIGKGTRILFKLPCREA
jgi:two-component sensor histidine kinase